MFRESFYSFLGGPRTFWGGGRTFVNNYFMQPPMFGHHHCQGDNGVSKLMGWAYVYNMMQNMVRPQQQVIYPPYQPQAYMPQQGAYPYVNFSGVEGAGGVSGEQQSNEDFANLYNMYKNDGYSFGRINGNYYAKAKDGTVYKGSTVEELADKLAEAPKSSTKTEKDDDVSLEDRLEKSDNSKTNREDAADNSSSSSDATGASDATGSGDASSSSGASEAGDSGSAASGSSNWKINAPEGEIWYHFKAIKCNAVNNKNEKIDEETLKKGDNIAQYIAVVYFGCKAGDDGTNRLIKNLIKLNPSVFNSNGTLKSKDNMNLDKLDLPTWETVKGKYQNSSSAPSGGSNTKDLGNNCKVENGKFYISGQEKSNVEFAKQYPDKFFANEPGNYSLKEVEELLMIYDDKYCETSKKEVEVKGAKQTITQKQKIFKKVSAVINANGNADVIAEYQGNGLLDNSEFTLQFSQSQTQRNGNENRIIYKIKGIYDQLKEHWK